MGKLKEINGYVRSTLDKLPGIRADLVRLDKDWQEWKFGQFTEALRQWTERNPISHERKPLDNSKKDRLFSTKQYGNKIRCVYCNKEDHKSIQYKAVTDTNKRRKILSEKKLCSLDVLSISEKEDVNNKSVLNKFKSQLLEKEGFMKQG